MARPFAYNTGAPIAGTTQVGDLAIGYPTAGFEATGLQWWQGPDESTGNVVAKPISAGNQPTPVTEDALYMDPSLKGPNIILSNHDQTATVPTGSVESVLGANVPIQVGSPTMFSVKYNSTGNTQLDRRCIGIGLPAMNYQGPFNGYPGNDIKSFGFSADGKCFFNSSQVSGDLTPWNNGDLIDIALSNGEIWIRVNNGNWNNDVADNPVNTGSGFTLIGLDNALAVLCPGINECTMTVLNTPPFGVPSGYNFLGNVSASVAFNRSSTLSEASFIELAETLTGQTFPTGNDAKTYLNDILGYWTSWV
jgi:hypothetical protein